MAKRFSEDAIGNGNGLACPFYNADREKYKDHKSCNSKRAKPWKMKDVSQHLWRCHSPRHHCEYCTKRWPSVARKNTDLVKAEHVAACRAEHNGVRRVRGPHEVDIMTEAQQEAFMAVRRIRGDNERKLEALYGALGLGVTLLETYHMRPLEGDSPPQGFDPAGEASSTVEELDDPGYWDPALADSDFLRGFIGPEIKDSGCVPDPPSRPLSWSEIGQASASVQTSGSEYIVPSGPPFVDSGYGSAAGGRNKEPETGTIDETPTTPSPCTRALGFEAAGDIGNPSYKTEVEDSDLADEDRSDEYCNWDLGSDMIGMDDYGQMSNS